MTSRTSFGSTEHNKVYVFQLDSVKSAFQAETLETVLSLSSLI